MISAGQLITSVGHGLSPSWVGWVMFSVTNIVASIGHRREVSDFYSHSDRYCQQSISNSNYVVNDCCFVFYVSAVQLSQNLPCYVSMIGWDM